MSALTKKIIILVWTFTLPQVLLCAQEETGYNQETKPLFNLESVSENRFLKPPFYVRAEEKTTSHFLDFLNKKAYASIDEGEEKKILRRQWRELLRVDIYYPYFKAKEVEDWASQKASFKFFNIKGRPKLEDNQVKYIFKKRF